MPEQVCPLASAVSCMTKAVAVLIRRKARPVQVLRGPGRFQTVVLADSVG
ncbi:hypothetical protein [Dactylosporangium sp. NPDC048998]